jgi:hypothetical protein
MKPLKLALTGALLAMMASEAPADPTVGTTTVLGPFVGPGATLHANNKPPVNPTIAFAGTDLGWNYVHNGNLQVLFGDTHATQAGAPIDPDYHPLAGQTAYTFDDGFGTIDLSVWNNPAGFNSGNIPKIQLAQHPSQANAKAVNPGHWSDAFKTPFGGWSNGTNEYAIFYTSKPQGCLNNTHCDDHLTALSCDTTLGFWNEEYYDQKDFTGLCKDDGFWPFCLDDTMIDGSGNVIAGTGFCRDTTSTIAASDDEGRMLSTAVKLRVGVRNTTDNRKYDGIKEWLTNRFKNPTIGTVQDFVPADPPGYLNHDFNVAGSSGANRRVFIWGRPGFVGINATNRKVGMYFAYVDMPVGTSFAWNVKYFIGTNASGVPQFSNSETAAVALDMDSTVANTQTGDTHDIVSLYNIVWVNHLHKWVMLYGGSVSNNPVGLFWSCGVTEFFVGDTECMQVNRGNHAIRMRTADNPYGPWSPPQDFFVPGNPEVNPPTGYYNGNVAGTPNIFYHPNCSGTCKASYGHPNYDASVEYGVPYAPTIVVPWLTAVGSSVDVIWFMSTWNPYGVWLMRTRINP